MRSKSKSFALDDESVGPTVVEYLDIPDKPTGLGARHIIAIMSFLGQAVSYMMRENLSVGIVAMVNQTILPPPTDNSTDSELVCPLPSQDPQNASVYTNGEFDWTDYEQGVVLSSFFWGYTLTQLPGGWLAVHYGAKWLILAGLGSTAVLSLVTPVIVRAGGLYAFIAIRIIQGLGEGVVLPATHCLISKWLPPLERSKFGGWVYAGNPLGCVIALLASGPLAASTFLGGWPSLFYVFGGIAIVWCVLWTFLVYDGPDVHPRITAIERDYILQSIGLSNRRKHLRTPWKAMLTSAPVWAVIIAQTGHGYGSTMLLTELPTYLSTILHYNVSDNGLISAIPYITMFVVSQVATWLADWLRSKRYLNTTNTRRVFNSLGHWVPAVALVAASYTGCNAVYTILLIAVSVGATGCVYAGSQISHIDLSPNFSGIMMGITNTLCNGMGIIAPYVVGILINDANNLRQWQIAFFIAAAIYFIDNLLYIILISGEEQPWNDVSVTDKYGRNTSQVTIVSNVSVLPY